MMFPKKCAPLPNPNWKKELKFGIPETAKKTPKAIPKVSQKKRERLKHGGEASLFAEIWDERQHSCELCGFPLKEKKAHNFDHIIPKSRGEQYRLDKSNIQIVCFACHYKKTTGQNYKGICLD